MSSSKKLKVTVQSGKGFTSKNGANKNDPYCEITILDDQGNKIGKPQTTKVLKATLDPQWNQLLEFSVPSTFSGMKLVCWDKHKFRADKFLGQITIKFNTSLLSSSEMLDDKFKLAKRKAKEDVSGEIHLQIQYGDIDKSKSKMTSSSSNLTNNNSTSTTTDQSADVKVSSNFNTDETNNKLKSSTHVVVVEEEEDEDDNNNSNGKDEGGDYEKVREGPATACLEKINAKDDKDVALSNKNYEVTNNSTNYYGLEYVKANVRVSSGKWYYEVRIQVTGSMAIGWCTKNCNPKTNTGDFWIYDGSRQQKQHNTQASTKYGEYWSTGDIIGCGIDIDNKSIQYWKNGKDMGVAHSGDVTQTESNGRFVPILGVARRTKMQVNFGKETFAYPQEGYNMLHSNLSDKEIEQLTKLFGKYKDLGNQGLNKDESTESDPKDSIHGEGMLEFQKDLGIVEDDDPLFLLIAYKLKAETLWELSREEFMNGFTIAGCATMDRIKSKAKEWKDEVKSNEKELKQWYNFVFDYLKEDKTILLIDEAVVAWNIVLKDKKWPLFSEFLDFLKAENKKSISRDAWQQLWHFMASYPSSLKDYDVASSSFPIIFDEFVEYWQAKNKITPPKK